MGNRGKMNEELIKITQQLGSSYAESKKWDKSKTEARAEFFKIAKEQHEILAEKIVLVDANSLADAIAMAEKLYPGWVPLSATQVENGFDVRIKENAEYKPFTFVNPEDGMVYQKQIVAGSVMFDDERFQKDHPELYNVVTYMPEPKRELRPLDELSDEVISIIQDYVYEGKPVVKLAAPRKAKEDEL
jgi:hypothetical protein